MHGKYQGFTLIELMIVIAIIGILAAIAIPQYQDYVGRSQMTEALSLAGAQKVVVLDAYGQHSSLLGIDNGTFAIPQAVSISGKYVASVTIKDGVITATLRATGMTTGIQGKTLTLTPTQVAGNSVLQWVCTSNAQQRYLPHNCIGM